MNEYEIILNNAPNYIYFDTIKFAIDRCKIQFQFHQETIKNNTVKCIFLGSTSAGKSTVINGLFGKNVIYSGVFDGTECVTQCQASSNNKDYFTMANKMEILNKEFEITELDYINSRNKNLEMFPDISCLIKVYLNPLIYPILENLVLIDCPGYDNEDIELIMNYCDNGNIFVFCFDVKNGVTPNDIKIINTVLNKVGNCEIIILFTKCDINKPIQKNFTEESLIKISNMKKLSIFYISAKEELEGKINSEFHSDFKDFRDLLLKYSIIIKQSMRNIFLDVVASVTAIIQSMSTIIPRVPFNNIEHLQDFIRIVKIFCPIKFNTLDYNINYRIKLMKTPYNRYQCKEAISDYCEFANKEISNFLTGIFLENTTVNDAPNIYFLFYERFIKSEEIQNVRLSYAHIGDKRKIYRNHFIDHYAKYKAVIYSSITKHYQHKVETFFNEWIKFGESLGNFKLSLVKMCN